MMQPPLAEYRCPLCDCTKAGRSWLGEIEYHDQTYEFRECRECRSLFCSPMPDEKALSQMYGPEYMHFFSAEHIHGGDRGLAQAVEVLQSRPAGVLFDYGCGSGALLKKAAGLGWNPVGFEFNSEAAETFKEISGIRIVSDLAELGDGFKADVINLGDVIEHLTDVNNQFRKLLGFVREGGIVIAQGPLEANLNLFFLGIRLSRRLRNGPVRMPPYHVMLASSEGQKRFFDRFGLARLTFDIFEVDHPAPERINFTDLRDPRKTGLYALRKISKVISAAFPNAMGNRYFYVGRKV